MKKIFMLLLLLIIPACSWFKPGCFLEDQAVTLATGVVVQQLQCSNPDAVHADLKEVVGKLGLCSQVATGPVADAMCPMLSQAVVGYLATKTIPAAWNCTAANAKDKVGQALTEACKKIPVSK